ncbi:hypothetical protein BS17DRAFT_734736 [Gyrodon lividus]|nr:hypothetical protein BS17DRAFT_734736 [Gyrodon lividus]
MTQPIHSTLASFPEELLVRILTLCVTPPPVLPSRPIWDIVPPPTPAAFSPIPRNLPPRNRLAPLLVSRQFLRIASPLFYHTLHLQSANQATQVLETLRHHPPLANAVRRVVFGGIWRDSAAVLTLCERVDDVDICLDSGPDHYGSPRPLNVSFGSGASASDVDAEAFCFALEQKDTIMHLTIRKDPAAYLTHPRPQYVLEHLARVIHKWSNLESIHLALRISSSPFTLPLAQALSEAPRLQSVRAQLPAVWNNLLLVMSSNPSLEKVTLYSEPMLGVAHNRTTPGSSVIKAACTGIGDNENAILATGLYMMETKKHARLSELIRAGTSIIRTRAHTTIATVSSLPVSTALLSASRAKQVAVRLLTNRHSLAMPAALPSAAIGAAQEV